MQQLFNRVIPFIMLGIALVAFAFGIVLLAYLFVFGAIIGLVLYIFTWIKVKFFEPKSIKKTPAKPGRTIDSDDWHVL